MGTKPVLKIDASGDHVVVTGPRDVMKKAMDLSMVRYLEVDGLIRVQMYDPPVRHAYRAASPVPVRVREAANGAIRFANAHPAAPVAARSRGALKKEQRKTFV
jgi:hypothetical protein